MDQFENSSQDKKESFSASQSPTPPGDRKASQDDDEANQTENRPWMRRLKKFGDESSFSGSIYAFKSQSAPKRMFWGTCVLASLTGFCVLTVYSILFLASRPIQTSITIAPQESLDFPTVTVCSLSYFNLTSLALLDKASQYNFSQRLLELFTSIEDRLPPDYEACQVIANDIHSSIPHSYSFSELIVTAGVDPTASIERCSFLGEDCKNNLSLVTTFDGKCFSFNGPNINESYRATGIGVRQGLRLQLFSGEQLFSTEKARGYRVVISNRGKLPRPESTGVSIGTNSILYVGMEKRELLDNTNLNSRTKEPCRETDSLYSDAFFSISGYPMYSVSNCQAQCLYKYMADTCGCVERDLYATIRSPYEEMRNCSVLDLCCETSAFESYRQTCRCPEQCESVEYALTVSSAEHSFDGMLGINVYYEDLQLETQETTDSYDPWQLISDIGGNSGLFLGFTLLTVVELIMLIVGLMSDAIRASWEKVKKKYFLNEYRESTSMKEKDTNLSIVSMSNVITDI